MAQKGNSPSPDSDRLRALAEERLAVGGSQDALLCDLQLHQIELEMQNETLRQAEAALAESRDRYLDLYEFAPVGYLTLDDLGTIREANLTAAGMLGLERGKLYGRRFDLFIGAAQRDAWQHVCLNLRHEGGARSLDADLECGHDCRFTARLDCLRKAGGLRITLSDISERVDSEQALLSSEQKFRSLFEYSLDAILLTTPEGEVLAANLAAQAMFGYSEEEICRLGRRGLVDSSDPRLRPGLALREREGHFSGELTFIDRDGRKFPAELTSAIFLGPDGRRMTSMFLRDISERMQMEQDLADLRGELQDLLEWQVARQTIAALAHQINQPLTSMAALCTAAQRMLAPERARATLAQPERLRQSLAQLAADTQRAGGVVRQLLSSLRSPDARVEATALAPLLHKAVRALRDQGDSGIRLVVECADGLAPVRVNGTQVVKVLMILIENSREAMHGGAGRHVWISAGPGDQEREVCVSVRDEGPGVTAGMEQDIFHPFVSGKPDGIGMGLAICRALVELQGGRLWLDTAAGPGATFRFTLPISR